MDKLQINHIQCDASVFLKMAKHCHEESQTSLDLPQGAILGMLDGTRLEITHCFPYPNNMTESSDDEEYQWAMMRRLRVVNVDMFHVGWYQSASNTKFLTETLLESQFNYQTCISESVVIVYDSDRSIRGVMPLKAYRLSEQAIKMYKEGAQTFKALQELGVGFEKLVVEIPIHIKSSSLTNILLLDMYETLPQEKGSQYLDLGTVGVLEKQIRGMMSRTDDLIQETVKFNRYQYSCVRQEHEKQRQLNYLSLENSARVAQGQKALSGDDIKNQFREISPPPRRISLILSEQINFISKEINQICSQSIAKLILTEPLQTSKEEKK
ncbi:CLUMA_CG018129, isoform A [Clunio marinus]|uniref:Eukaryotic translation initiation factor 3 subunit H n=1 Tax=Clunio marinus TaxID=568069 RepID=A0A1J1IYZ3_9DIPT|nr:CLUMA_CG018129, isoform A [Clunio marinus]